MVASRPNASHIQHGRPSALSLATALRLALPFLLRGLEPIRDRHPPASPYTYFLYSAVRAPRVGGTRDKLGELGSGGAPAAGGVCQRSDTARSTLSSNARAAAESLPGSAWA